MEFQSLASVWCGFKSAFSTLLASSSPKFKFERLKKISALCGSSSSDALIHQILICSKEHNKYSIQSSWKKIVNYLYKWLKVLIFTLLWSSDYYRNQIWIWVPYWALQRGELSCAWVGVYINIYIRVNCAHIKYTWVFDMHVKYLRLESLV